jgi:hypothetical protein
VAVGGRGSDVITFSSSFLVSSGPIILFVDTISLLQIKLLHQYKAQPIHAPFSSNEYPEYAAGLKLK